MSKAIGSVYGKSISGWLNRHSGNRNNFEGIITLNNVSNPVALTDYQVKLDLTALNFNFGSTLADGSDIRVKDSDNITVIPHHLVSYNKAGKTGEIWTKVPSIPALTSKALYISGGNISRPTSGKSVFPVYDDFGRYIENAATPQVTPTYDGSGQAVHPSVRYFPNGWRGYKYWMGMTPYPSANDALENPSILACNDGATWVVPPGVTNPLAPAPICDHNCDPFLLYKEDIDELWLYYLATYRAVSCAAYTAESYYDTNILRVCKSSDGVNWSAAEDVMSWNLAVTNLYVSPTIAKVGATYYMWITDGATREQFRYDSTDALTWINKVTCTGLPASLVWHTDVLYIPSKSVYLLAYCLSGSLSPLHIYKSTDGLAWTRVPQSFLDTFINTRSAWDNTVYRTCLEYNPITEELMIWYSGYNGAPSVFAVGYVALNIDQLINSFRWTLATLLSYSSEQYKTGSISAKAVQTAGTSIAAATPCAMANDMMVDGWFYDDMDTVAMALLRLDGLIGVGVYTTRSTGFYIYHSKAFVYSIGSVPRSVGWHYYQIRIRPDSAAEFYVDNILIGTLTAQFATATSVRIAGSNSLQCTFYVDNIRVRKATTIQPVVTIA